MNTIKTYKPDSHFVTITFKMIAKIEMLNIPINKKFDYCKRSIAQAIVNPLKVSYIKKEKRKSLKQHAKIDISISPTPEQRNKYFSACSLEKFANNIFNKKNITEEQLNTFNDIVKQAKERANANLTKELQTFKAHDIPNIYHINNGSDSKQFQGFYISEKNDINNSCMQGKPRKYFALYTDIEESQAVEMATLTQGNEIVARALVWFDVPADEVGKDVIQPRDIYIDRIYTKTQEHRPKTQTDLYFKILNHYKVEKGATKEYSTPSGPKQKIVLPNCYNANNIFDTVKALINTTKEIQMNSYCRFDVETNNDCYEYYPYLDTLQWFDAYKQKLTSDEEHGSDILKLDNTNGQANNTHECCENCGSEIYENEERYIETQEITTCPECAVYCDERDEFILMEDAVYNNNSGEYLYRGDLDI
tara:strand:- start:170 stop:1429 length:1260 start_codon:yes stop_codon:yes gene_type:complete